MNLSAWLARVWCAMHWTSPTEVRMSYDRKRLRVTRVSLRCCRCGHTVHYDTGGDRP